MQLRRGVRLVTLLLALFVLLVPRGTAADDEAGENDSEQQEPETNEASENEAEQEDAADAEKAEPDDKSLFDEIMKQNSPDLANSAQVQNDAASSAEAGAIVQVPLADYVDVSRRLDHMRRAQPRQALPRVVLGEASYEGEVDRGTLALRMKLHVTLAGEGLKTVPLTGDDVALLSATADGKPIGATRRPGYHVWVTDRRGVVPIELSLLVPPRGKRGSIEYAFRAVRTPAATLSVRLPAEGLLPRFDGAVASEVRAEKGGTGVRATLEPTTRIRLVGFRDIDPGENRSAKLYAEMSSLLSADEHAVELFTVARYNILYGATQSFDLFVPEGLEVVSADGEGAFRFAAEPREGGAVLHGETAFPIQGSYEVSLRLRYKNGQGPKGERTPLHVLLPRCLGVEREHGWLAVEVPGKLRLDEVSRKDITAVDVRQLPSEVLGSAVSPILKAYRYHLPSPALDLATERLPEEELADGAIDRIDAVTVLSAEGRLLTELRVTLRNALRPSLSLVLPEGAEVRSAQLDGELVKPSRAGNGDGNGNGGELLLPLKRSRGEERQDPFTLIVLIESARPPLGLLGMQSLALPATDLTVAALHWQLHLPANNHYGELRVAIAPQTYAGDTSWHKPPHVTRAVRWDEEGAGAGGSEAAPGSPSRIELPRTGIELAYHRYWVSAGESVRVEVPYIRFWLLRPFELLLAVLLAAGLSMAPLSRDAPRRARLLRIARIIAAAAVGIALWQAGGALYAGAALAAGLTAFAYKRRAHERLGSLRIALVGLPDRLRAWRRRQAFSERRLLRAIALALGSAAVAWMLATRIVWLIKVIGEMVGLST